MSDDDWFERALREAEQDDGDAGADDGEDATDAPNDGANDERQRGEDASDDEHGDAEPSDRPVDSGFASTEEGFDDIDDGSFGAGVGGDFDEAADDAGEPDTTGGDEFGGDEFGGPDGSGGVDDGADGETPDRSTGDAGSERSAEPDTPHDADPFGGVSEDPDGDVAPDPAPADGDGGPADDPFGDDFGAAMQGAPGTDGPGGGGGDDFDGGFGDFGGDFEGGFGGGEPGGGSPDFDEEEFESNIPRIDLGIEGLDEMILGGIPERSLMAVIGSAGTGKTTFALQFLNEVLEDGGNGIYITLEESREAILSTAEEKGWEFRRHAEADRLAVVAMDPIEMANSLDSIRDDISRLVTEFGADRLVLDSVSLLEMMYDHPSKRRSEVFDFARSLKEAGVTTMLTSEASEENAFASRHGIVEYLTDAVFVLRYVRPSDFRETRLAIEIQKIRDANHSRETKPYEIMDDGISVYRQANIF
ncbi:KaiC domain-containing protein [Halobaculum rubrum]|uniref:KaiC domain-containing protein n=1 Tax=Halobaculum rubrum TaxID=2872158 RepID=UPI001CECED1A|nr:KaiC domain-containing protein [Halobaculum rubrum]